jgi:hypothetical protein
MMAQEDTSCRAVANSNHRGIDLVMAATKRHMDASLTARTIRFPKRVRDRIFVDAERCGRSFEGQVIAVLRRHYGEDVDIAPSADAILDLARGSLKGITAAEQRKLVRRLTEHRP